MTLTDRCECVVYSEIAGEYEADAECGTCHGAGTLPDTAVHDYLVELLRQLDAEVPPPPGCHHALMVIDGVLTLQVNKAGKFLPVIIDPEDTDKLPQALAGEILQLLQASPMRPAVLPTKTGHH